jgi:hypothetical protein
LSEFLSIWLDDIPIGPADFSVQFIASADEYRKLANQRAEAALRTAPFLSLDSGVLMLAGWTEAEGVQVLTDEKGCFYRMGRDRLQIVTVPGNRWARLGLLRVVRELLALRTLARPAMIDLHAAAFMVQNRAVLVAGAKNTGKTTLLVYALTSGQAGLLANDRVLVDWDSGQVWGVPTVVMLREATARIFPCLTRGLPKRAALLHAGELALGEAPEEEPFLTRSLAQLAGQTGAALIPRAPLGAIVFPQISAATAGLAVEPMGLAEATACLRENLYGRRSGSRQSTLLHRIAGASSKDDAHGMERLLATVPLLACRLGPDAYRDGAHAWLQALPLGEGSRIV